MPLLLNVGMRCKAGIKRDLLSWEDQQEKLLIQDEAETLTL